MGKNNDSKVPSVKVGIAIAWKSNLQTTTMTLSTKPENVDHNPSDTRLHEMWAFR